MKVSRLLIGLVHAEYDGSDRNPRHICHPVVKSAEDCQKMCIMVKNCHCFTWTKSNGYCWFRRQFGWQAYENRDAWSACPTFGMPIVNGIGYSGGDVGCCGD